MCLTINRELHPFTRQLQSRKCCNRASTSTNACPITWRMAWFWMFLHVGSWRALETMAVKVSPLVTKSGHVALVSRWNTLWRSLAVTLCLSLTKAVIICIAWLQFHLGFKPHDAWIKMHLEPTLCSSLQTYTKSSAPESFHFPRENWSMCKINIYIFIFFIDLMINEYYKCLLKFVMIKIADILEIDPKYFV